MGCGIATVKYLLFIFNLVFALCGLAILVVGALSYADIEETKYFMDKVNENVNVSAAPIALIVVGSIVFVIAFFGCCGAIRESHCMVVTFAVFLLVILIIEIAIGIVAFVNRDDVDVNQTLNASIAEIFEKYPADNNTRNQVDNLQRKRECCGVDGPDYWINVRKLSEVPKSCCVDPDKQCTIYTNAHQVFQDGCVKKLQQMLSNNGLLLGALAVTVGVVEITGVVFALCLASSIKNKERRVY